MERVLGSQSLLERFYIVHVFVTVYPLPTSCMLEKSSEITLTSSFCLLLGCFGIIDYLCMLSTWAESWLLPKAQTQHMSTLQASQWNLKPFIGSYLHSTH